MSRCRNMVDIGRRQFLRGGAIAAASATVAAVAPAAAQEAKGVIPSAGVEYPSNRLGNIKDLTVNEPLDVAYPDDDAAGVLLKLGVRVEGGVGPDGDIVGFSTICPHKGYPLSYSADQKTLNCPGHYSVFDPEKGGQQVWGQSTQNLPQYVLRVADNGDVFAEGIDELLYGRLSNVI
ncbi:arsenate reductase (azurin) small subunit [Agrobacterium sp. P15N1-A]|uniref:arsenate reductase (azurin) small subunit n=1 Tax=Agrobacterium sp. P15N1-A TaxID=3342820 RepID=UPI0037DD75F5